MLTLKSQFYGVFQKNIFGMIIYFSFGNILANVFHDVCVF